MQIEMRAVGPKMEALAAAQERLSGITSLDEGKGGARLEGTISEYEHQVSSWLHPHSAPV